MECCHAGGYSYIPTPSSVAIHLCAQTAEGNSKCDSGRVGIKSFFTVLPVNFYPLIINVIYSYFSYPFLDIVIPLSLNVSVFAVL